MMKRSSFGSKYVNIPTHRICSYSASMRDKFVFKRRHGAKNATNNNP